MPMIAVDVIDMIALLRAICILDKTVSADIEMAGSRHRATSIELAGLLLKRPTESTACGSALSFLVKG